MKTKYETAYKSEPFHKRSIGDAAHGSIHRWKDAITCLAGSEDADFIHNWVKSFVDNVLLFTEDSKKLTHLKTALVFHSPQQCEAKNILSRFLLAIVPSECLVVDDEIFTGKATSNVVQECRLALIDTDKSLKEYKKDLEDFLTYDWRPPRKRQERRDKDKVAGRKPVGRYHPYTVENLYYDGERFRYDEDVVCPSRGMYMKNKKYMDKKPVWFKTANGDEKEVHPKTSFIFFVRPNVQVATELPLVASFTSGTNLSPGSHYPVNDDVQAILNFYKNTQFKETTLNNTEIEEFVVKWFKDFEKHHKPPREGTTQFEVEILHKSFNRFAKKYGEKQFESVAGFGKVALKKLKDAGVNIKPRKCSKMMWEYDKHVFERPQ